MHKSCAGIYAIGHSVLDLERVTIGGGYIAGLRMYGGAAVHVLDCEISCAQRAVEIWSSGGYLDATRISMHARSKNLVFFFDEDSSD